MNNIDMFKLLYESNLRPNFNHITIVKPNLSFLKVFVDEFEYVKHQNHNSTDFHFPIMMASQYLIDRSALLNISIDCPEYSNYEPNLKFWFMKDVKHKFEYDFTSLSLIYKHKLKSYSVSYRELYKRKNMTLKQCEKYFNDLVFGELCKNFGDLI